MAYTAATLFPGTAAGEGSNNRKLQDTSLAANNATTTCVFGTTTTVRFIQAQPATANSTSATPAAAQDRGWNVLKADMNEASSPPNRRHIPAGNWTFQGALTASTSDAASSSYRVRVFVHRRGSTGALTQIGSSGDSAAAAITTSINWSVTVNLPEVLLATDETIHVEYWVQGRGGGATGLLAQTITFNVGTTTLQDELTIALPSPGIRTRFLRTLAAIMAGVAARGALKIKKTLSRTVSCVAAMTRRLTLFRRFAVIASGVPSFARRLTIRRTLAVIAACAPRGFIKLPFGKVPGGAGSGATYPRSRVVNET